MTGTLPWFLGFDPSLTQFGWAIYNPNEVGRDTCPDRGRFRTSSKDLFVARYCDLRERVMGLVERTGIRRVGIEYPVFNEMYSEGMYGLFLFTCEALWRAECDVVFFSPGQLKANAREHVSRPKGWKMEKPDMVEAAKNVTGGKGRWNHNEADGFWAARTGGRFWMVHDGLLDGADLTPVERKQFMQIHTYTRGKNAGKTVMTGVLYREDERFFQWTKGTT